MVLMLLRFLAIFSLLLIFINPKIKSRQLLSIPPELNLLIDNSMSIAYDKSENYVKDMITAITTNDKLNDKFKVNIYQFSDDLYTYDSLTFEGTQTNIVKSLEKLNSIQPKGTSATVLLTDGNQTFGSNYAYYKASIPVFPIVIGDTSKYEDLYISRINVNRYTNLNNKFPVEIFVNYEGDYSINTSLQIQNKGGRNIYSKQIQLSRANNSEKIELYLDAHEVGLYTYTCSLTSLKNEKNTVNNFRNFSIEVIDEQAKIGIISAINHPDLGALKRSIETNKQRKAIIINDLNKKFQIKDYQFVILYQPNNKFSTLFKDILESNTSFLVITGTETNWNFLNYTQPFFTKNAINKTEAFSANFNADFNEFITEDIAFSTMPPVRDYFGDISFSVPYNIVLFQTISGIETDKPLLATFSDNETRRAVIFGEDIWKWRMFTKVESNSYDDFDIFFNKIIQYLSLNKQSSRLEVNYEPYVYSNSEFLINAKYFDANYTFDKQANLMLTIYEDLKEVKQMPFTLRNESFIAKIADLIPGNYTFKVEVADVKLSKRGSFTILNYNLEQQLNTANNEGLLVLANNSSGKLFYQDQQEALFSKLLTDKRFLTTQKSSEKVVSLIEWKWLLAFLVLFLSGEWFIRKYKGLI